MVDIKEIFKDKNFEDGTLKLIENFINEFDDLFGKYVTREEIINRIKNNLEAEVEFVDFMKPTQLGRYNLNDKRILLKRGMSEEETKSVFFHEMIHCITVKENFIGFPMGFDEVAYLNGEEQEFKHTAIGLTEGFTEYVTKIRNQKYGYTSRSYPILSEQTENLAEVIGEEKFLDIGFNKPEEIFTVMVEEEIVPFESDVDDFLKQFDELYKYEDEILIDKFIKDSANTGKSGTEALMLDILGVRDSKKLKLDKIKAYIVKTLLSKVKKMDVNTKEDLMSIQERIAKYTTQLGMGTNYEASSILFDKIAELEEIGKSREEILEMLPKSTRKLAEYEFKYREFMELPPEEMLEKMANSEVDIYDEVIAGPFEKKYGSEIVKKIFQGIQDDELAYELSLQLTDKFAKTILDKGWNPQLMSFEFIELDYPTGLTFNIYEADGENLKYLATFSDANDDYKMEEMRVCLATEKLKILEENPILDSNSVLMKGKSGTILSYNGNNDYTFINDSKEIFVNNEETSIFFSEAEITQKRLRAAAERYQNMERVAPGTVILKDIGRRVSTLEMQRDQIRGKRKFTPIDIEKATEEVTLEKVQKILEEIGEPEQSIQETLEKGIGYNE